MDNDWFCSGECYLIYHEQRWQKAQENPAPSASLSFCRSCKAPITWLKTETGKFIPVNPDSVKDRPLNNIYNSKIHVSHFATCPQAKGWRNK